MQINPSSEGPLFDLVGNAQMKIVDKTLMLADRIVFSGEKGPQLLGNARVSNGHQGFELSADNIRCGEETVLEGDAWPDCVRVRHLNAFGLPSEVAEACHQTRACNDAK